MPFFSRPLARSQAYPARSSWKRDLAVEVAAADLLARLGGCEAEIEVEAVEAERLVVGAVPAHKLRLAVGVCARRTDCELSQV
jgi:hypothetical protein